MAPIIIIVIIISAIALPLLEKGLPIHNMLPRFEAAYLHCVIGHWSFVHVKWTLYVFFADVVKLDEARSRLDTSKGLQFLRA